MEGLAAWRSTPHPSTCCGRYPPLGPVDERWTGIATLATQLFGRGFRQQFLVGLTPVAVYPGDVLVGDADGVIVIPRHLTDEIAHAAIEQERLEQYLHTRVKAGEALWGVYPPNEQTLADYEEWRAQSNE